MASGLMPLNELLAQWGGSDVVSFQKCARYYEAMDLVLYLQEDVSYRADRVDAFLTLLWHPAEERAIGVKLKGWRYIFQRLQSIQSAGGMELTDSHFVSLMVAVEVALTASAGNEITADAERRRIDERYAKAREVVAGVSLDVRDMAVAA